jgi:hypothetical protein
MHLGKIYMDCFLTIPVSRPAKYSSMTITFLFNITKIKGNNLHMRLTHHDTSIEKGNKDSANPWRGRPQMILKDINHDGGKELIVILTTGTGTGYHTEDIHVLNPASFEEIKVEPAADIVKEKLDSIIEDDAEQKAIHIIIADEKTPVRTWKCSPSVTCM